MADNPNVQQVVTEAVDAADGNKDPNELSLEALVLLINTERLDYLHESILSEFTELKDRQDQVTELHKLLKEVNNATDKDGELDWSDNEEMQQLLENAKELGIEIKEGKKPYQFSREERERLIENIRMTVDDINVKNDMQLQKITRLTNERYESYQMARSILKPLHDDKVNKARAIAGK